MNCILMAFQLHYRKININESLILFEKTFLFNFYKLISIYNYINKTYVSIILYMHIFSYL